MKKVSVIIAVVLVSFSTIFAQEEVVKVKEAGLTFSNVSSFGLTYRFGNENAVWRVNAVSGRNTSYVSNTDDEFILGERTSKNSNVNVSFGREYRKSLVDKLEFRYGMDLSLGYSNTQNEYTREDRFDDDLYENEFYSSKSSVQNITPGMNLVLGFNYLISDAIVLGAEVQPNFSFTSGKNEVEYISGEDIIETDNSSNTLSYGLTNNGVLLSLAYRF